MPRERAATSDPRQTSLDPSATRPVTRSRTAATKKPTPPSRAPDPGDATTTKPVPRSPSASSRAPPQLQQKQQPQQQAQSRNKRKSTADKAPDYHGEGSSSGSRTSAAARVTKGLPKSTKKSQAMPQKVSMRGKGRVAGKEGGSGREVKNGKGNKEKNEGQDGEGDEVSEDDDGEGGEVSEDDDGEEDEGQGTDEESEDEHDSSQEAQARRLYQFFNKSTYRGGSERQLERAADEGVNFPNNAVLQQVFSAERACTGTSEENEADLAQDEETAAKTRLIGNVLWKRVPLRSAGGWFWKSPTNERDFILESKPAPASGQETDDCLDASKQMLLDFIERKLDLGVEVPDWLTTPEALAELREWLSGKHVRLSPIFQELLRKLNRREKVDGTWWLERRAQSAGDRLAAVAEGKEGAEKLAADLKDIVYGRIGITAKEWTEVYVGESEDGETRFIFHDANTVLHTLAGLEKAPLNHQRMGKNDVNLFFAFVHVDAGSPKATGKVLAAWEAVVAWLLAALQLNKKLLQARADYGLPPLAGVTGVNATLCLEDSYAEKAPRDEAKGVVDGHYKALLHLQLGVMTEAVKAQYEADSAGPSSTDAGAAARANAEAARRLLVKIKKAVHDKQQQLVTSGNMLYDWDLDDEESAYLGRRLGLCTREDLKKRYGVRKGRFAIQFEVAKTIDFDKELVITYPEEDAPLFRRFTLKISLVGGSKKKAVYDQYFTSLILPLYLTRLLNRFFSWLTAKEQAERRAAADAKSIEIEKRKVPDPKGPHFDFDQLDELAKNLRIGKAQLYGLKQVYLGGGRAATCKIVKSARWLKGGDKGISRVCGFGNRSHDTGKMPKTWVRAVDDEKNPLYNAKAKIWHPAQRRISLVFLAIDGTWQPLPKPVDPPREYVLPHEQRKKQYVRKFLNAVGALFGVPSRPEVEYPPGVAAPRRWLQPASNETRTGHVYPVELYPGARLYLSLAMRQAIYDCDDVPSTKAGLAAMTNITTCDGPDTFKIWLRAEDLERPWVEYRAVSEKKRLGLYEIWAKWKRDFEEAKYPFPTQVPLPVTGTVNLA